MGAFQAGPNGRRSSNSARSMFLESNVFKLDCVCINSPLLGKSSSSVLKEKEVNLSGVLSNLPLFCWVKQMTSLSSINSPLLKIAQLWAKGVKSLWFDRLLVGVDHYKSGHRSAGHIQDAVAFINQDIKNSIGPVVAIIIIDYKILGLLLYLSSYPS